MARLIMSQETIEKEAQILADYKNKKMNDLEKFIKTIEKTFEKELDQLIGRMQDMISIKMQQVFSTQEQKKLMKDIGLIEPKPKTGAKTKKGKKRKTPQDLKKELIDILNKQMKEEFQKSEVDMLYGGQEGISVSEELVKEAPKKKKRGRPKGSKNKNTALSVYDQPIKYVDSEDW